MARRPTYINKTEFQSAVNQLEAAQTFENPSHLWKAVAASDYGAPYGKTHGFWYGKAKELSITYRAQPGNRGQNISPLKGRKVKRTKSNQYLNVLKESSPSSYHNLIDRAAQGSMSACLKLKCLECCGFDRVSVRECHIVRCPTYAFRPYQASAIDEVDADAELIESK